MLTKEELALAVDAETHPNGQHRIRALAALIEKVATRIADERINEYQQLRVRQSMRY